MARFNNSPVQTERASAAYPHEHTEPYSNGPAFGRRGTATQEPKTNGYPGKCTACGQRVEAREGLLTGRAGAWTVEHRDGECPLPVEVPAKAQEAAPASQSFAVPEGRYTVQFEDGTYRTLKVSKQDDDADFMPGRFLLAYLSGSNNDSDYKRFAHVDPATGNVVPWKAHRDNESLREAVRVLLGDPRGASKAYATASGCCGVCGRTLTTPESIAAGIGPVCAEKTGW